MDRTTTVVVIEDQEFTERVIRAALRDRPFDIMTANNGEDGFDLVVKVQPDLVLLDLSLPGKDGWQILAEMRGHPDLAETPVIIVSAQGRTAVEARSEDYDVAAFVNKPFRVPDLREAVDSVLAARKTA